MSASVGEGDRNHICTHCDPRGQAAAAAGLEAAIIRANALARGLRRIDARAVRR